MKTIHLSHNPDYKELVDVYDQNALHKEEIKIVFPNKMELYLIRKYTYTGRVIKTNYLHGLLCFPDGREHSKLREQKDGSFTISSYYK